MRRLLLYRPTAVMAIIKLNIIVYLLWLYEFSSEQRFMERHFLVSFSALVDHRWWTLMTSVFSHHLFFHLLINMYVLFGFGAVVEKVLGSRRFLIFYLLAGAFSSLSHSLVSSLLLHEPSLPALGASGAVAGVIILFSFLFPREKILLLGIIPMPAYAAVLFFIGLDLVGLISQTRGSYSPIGHGAHLGGALFGLLYWLILLRSPSRQHF